MDLLHEVMQSRHSVYQSYRYQPVRGYCRPQTQTTHLLPGSANGFCLNSLGLEDGFSIPVACLNVIKGELCVLNAPYLRLILDPGKRIPLDLCSVAQGSKRWFSFMSLAAGLMMVCHERPLVVP